jgi:hypothetical protein
MLKNFNKSLTSFSASGPFTFNKFFISSFMI